VPFSMQSSTSWSPKSLTALRCKSPAGERDETPEEILVARPTVPLLELVQQGKFRADSRRHRAKLLRDDADEWLRGLDSGPGRGEAA
jgi:hypothetical protein